MARNYTVAWTPSRVDESNFEAGVPLSLIQEKEEEEEEEEEDGPCCVFEENTLDCLALSAWAFFSAMVLVFQLMSYRRAVLGELEISWRVKAAGWFGIALALYPFCLCLHRITRGHASAQSSIVWFFRVVTLILMFTFMITFICVMKLPITQSSSLERVETTISIQPGCPRGKLLHVSEVLTYFAEPPTLLNATVVTSVRRTLPGQIMASDFTAEGVSVVTNVTVAGKRQFMPSKTDMNYGKKKPIKIVTLGFSKLTIFFGQQILRYSIRFNYTARLKEAKCSNANSSQCGVWSVPEASNKPVTTSLSLFCPSQAGCTTVDKGKATYDIIFNIPGLQIGTGACPWAWKKPEQSWIWYVGAVFLAIGVAICSCGGANPGNQGTAVFALVGLVFVAIGGVICLIAAAVDRIA